MEILYIIFILSIIALVVIIIRLYLDVAYAKKRYIQLEKLNAKFSQTIVTQYAEIERLSAIVKEYREVFKGKT